MRLRPRGWQVYLLLLVASHLVVGLRSGAPERPGLRELQLARVDSDGELAGGRPVRIVWREAGDGEAVLLIHGSPGSGTNFALMLPLLSDAGYRGIAPDLPGFGASSRWIPDYSITAHARYLLAAMDAWGVGRAHLFGFSMGSGVALRMYELAPERVRSIAFYGGIGIQEGEGSGSYGFEHFKYAAGWAGLVALPELLPHFGLLGRRATRHAFIRNFWDSDQRPLRGLLDRLDVPLQVLHGRHDPLVPAWVAEEHHRIVADSELVMFDASHFMVFRPAGARRLAEPYVDFLDARRRGEPMLRRTDDRAPLGADPIPPRYVRSRPRPWIEVAAVAAGAIVSEELTLLAAGRLIGPMRIDFFVAMLGLWAGVFVSHGLLLAAGARFGRPTRLGSWAADKPWRAALVSRLVPGFRVWLLLHAGAAERPGRFVRRWLAVQLAAVPCVTLFAAPVAGLFDGAALALLRGGFPLLMLIALPGWIVILRRWLRTR